jgi:hypothetical protein
MRVPASIPPRLLLVSALLVLASAAFAVTMQIEAEFFGGFDIGAYRTWAWREGNPAANFEIEKAVREAVEERMAKKGYRLVSDAEAADCRVVTRVVRDEGFPAGVLKVEVVDAADDELAWRGMATGVFGAASPKKVASAARKAVKKMFKRFPEASALPLGSA